jgi:hypothetical protein
MTTETSTAVLVLTEPTNRAELDAERTMLLGIQLPDAISSPQEYQALAAEQERVQRFMKRAMPAFDKVCDDAHRAWKSATVLRSMFFDSLEKFNTRARQLLGDYKTAQERARREAEQRLAEEEHQREQERLEAEARLLDKQGQASMAAAVRATPVIAPAVSLPSTVPEVVGLTYTTHWTWRIAGSRDPQGGRKDKDARKRAAALVPREFLDLDDAAITSRVTSMKSLAKIPGIEVYSEQIPVRR